MGKKIIDKRPIILAEGEYSERDLALFQKKHNIWKVVDIYENQLTELFEITHPQFLHTSIYTAKRSEFVKSKLKDKSKLNGNWVYFPWSGILVHMVNKNDYEILITNRNKNLITSKEQKKLSEAVIGVTGLSIGSNVVITLIHSGIGSTMKLADKDTLQTSNLNRVITGVWSIGDHKLDIVCKKAYEVNPYIDLIRFESGLNENNLIEFVTATPKPNLIIELMDDFKMKIRLRQLCRSNRIPVLMMTNLGDSILVDVDRYDLDDQLPLFPGQAEELIDDILNKDLTPEDMKTYAVLLVGKRNVPQRAIESITEIGKTLVGRPQLMSTITVASGVASFIARRIILGKSVKNGRKIVKFDKVFINT